MRKFVVAALAAASLAAVAPATAPAHSSAPITATAAKSCSSGWKHAVIGGAQKCLRRGQFCAHRYDRQYRRYGYRCRKQDARGNYHLT